MPNQSQLYFVGQAVAAFLPADLHFYLSATGNDVTGDGSETAPWASIGRINQELSLYISVGDLIITWLGGGSLVWDEPLNLCRVCRSAYVVRNFTNVSAVLTIAAGSNDHHIRLTGSPGVAADDRMLRVESSADPTLVGQLRLIQGYRPRGTCLVALAANDTLSGLANRDGQVIAAGTRILAFSQTNPLENGIYNAAAGAWTRAKDSDNAIELSAATTAITAGTFAGSTFTQLVDLPTIGVIAQVWSTTPSLLVTSVGYTAALSAGDTVRVVRAGATVTPALPDSAYPDTYANGPGSLYLFNVEEIAGADVIGFRTAMVAGLHRYGTVEFPVITNREPQSDLTYPNEAGDTTLIFAGTGDFSWVDETWVTTANVAGLGAVVLGTLNAFSGSGVFHASSIFMSQNFWGEVRVLAGVIRGETEIRLGRLSLFADQVSLPLHGRILATGSAEITLSTVFTDMGIIFCAVAKSLIEGRGDASVGLTGPHQGFSSTGYGIDCEQGGSCNINAANPSTFEGSLGDNHVRLLTEPLSYFTPSRTGLIDKTHPNGTGGRIVLINTVTSGTTNARNVRVVTGLAVLAVFTDRSLIADTSAAACSVQAPNPADRFEPLHLFRTSGANTLTFLRFGAELINGVAADFTGFVTGEFALVETDGVDWWIG